MNLPAVPDPADFDRGPLRYQLLPPLTADERESLRQSIEAVGVLQPVVVDEAGAIIDGHHRAEDRGGAGPVLPKQNPAGLTEAEKLETALVLNLGRRHLDTEQAPLALPAAPARSVAVLDLPAQQAIPKSTVARQAGGAPNWGT